MHPVLVVLWLAQGTEAILRACVRAVQVCCALEGRQRRDQPPMLPSGWTPLGVAQSVSARCLHHSPFILHNDLMGMHFERS